MNTLVIKLIKVDLHSRLKNRSVGYNRSGGLEVAALFSTSNLTFPGDEAADNFAIHL